MMVERGTWLVPTLTAGDTTDELAEDPHVARGGPREAPRRWVSRSTTRSGSRPRPA